MQMGGAGHAHAQLRSLQLPSDSTSYASTTTSKQRPRQNNLLTAAELLEKEQMNRVVLPPAAKSAPPLVCAQPAKPRMHRSIVCTVAWNQPPFFPLETRRLTAVFCENILHRICEMRLTTYIAPPSFCTRTQHTNHIVKGLLTSSNQHQRHNGHQRHVHAMFDEHKQAVSSPRRCCFGM